MTPWQQRAVGTVLAGAILATAGFTWTWVSRANQSHETTATEEPEQTEIGKLVDILGQRAAAEDAAIDQTIKLCKRNQVSDCRTCKIVGVYDTKACKKK